MTLAQLCFSFKGRISRRLFWGYGIASLLALFLFVLAIDATGSTPDNIDTTAGSVVMFICVITFLPKLFYMDFAVSAKRLHDTNRSGWCALIAFIPVIGSVYILIVCGFIKGTEGENKYGVPVNKLT